MLGSHEPHHAKADAPQIPRARASFRTGWPKKPHQPAAASFRGCRAWGRKGARVREPFLTHLKDPTAHVPGESLRKTKASLEKHDGKRFRGAGYWKPTPPGSIFPRALILPGSPESVCLT